MYILKILVINLPSHLIKNIERCINYLLFASLILSVPSLFTQERFPTLGKTELKYFGRII